MEGRSETADVTEPAGTASRGGIVRTGLCVLALAGYASAGWLATRATDLLGDAGAVPDGVLSMLTAEPEALIGPVFLVGALLAVHVAAGLLLAGLGVAGTGSLPLVPPPAFDERRRHNLRWGGLLLGAAAVAGAAVVAAPIAGVVDVTFLTGLGGLLLVGVAVLYLIGLAFVLSPLVPSLAADRAGAVTMAAGPALLAIDAVIRRGLVFDPIQVTAIAAVVEVAVVIGVFRPLTQLVPAIEDARREWLLFLLAVPAAIAAWSVGSIVSPALPSAFGVLAVLAVVPPFVAARGYAV